MSLGDGTRSELRRVIAEVRACLSCTNLFHHEGKALRREIRAPGCESLLRTCPSLLPLIPEIDHLPNVMLHVRGTLHHHVKAGLSIRPGA